ncbi:MAG: hypothetical protein JW869_00565 [Candidatus Omnitrophica bacterium]|nr:hypothetical protein [Candidatus Omnitrophota bacterium]
MNAQDIKDIKPPVFFISNSIYLIIIAAAIMLAVSLFFLYRFWKNRMKQKPKIAAPPKPAHQIAYDALEALRAKNLPAQGKIKEYYYELSNIARYYLENRFNMRAPEMTTEEFLFSLGYSQDLSAKHKELLKNFLSLCDIVKFAKYGPSAGEIEDSFNAAKKLVDDTKITGEKREKVLVG